MLCPIQTHSVIYITVQINKSKIKNQIKRIDFTEIRINAVSEATMHSPHIYNRFYCTYFIGFHANAFPGVFLWGEMWRGSLIKQCRAEHRRCIYINTCREIISTRGVCFRSRSLKRERHFWAGGFPVTRTSWNWKSPMFASVINQLLTDHRAWHPATGLGDLLR